MSIKTPEEFERCLMHILCRKFSLREAETTLPADKLATKILKFSRFNQSRVLKTLYQFSAKLITSEALFIQFLNSVCTEICQQDEEVEKKFLILGAFITNLTTMAFMMPCYRLVRDMKTVLPSYFNQSRLADLDVTDGYLETVIIESPAQRWKLQSQLNRVAKFVKEAGKNICPTPGSRTDTIATRIVAVHYMRARNSAAATNEGQACPYCNENCKPYIRPFLTLESNQA